MSVIAMSEAKAKLSSLVADPHYPGRYEELVEALNDLNDIEAAARFREHSEPTMEAGEFSLGWTPTGPRQQGEI